MSCPDKGGCPVLIYKCSKIPDKSSVTQRAQRGTGYPVLKMAILWAISVFLLVSASAYGPPSPSIGKFLSNAKAKQTAQGSSRGPPYWWQGPNNPFRIKCTPNTPGCKGTPAGTSFPVGTGIPASSGTGTGHQIIQTLAGPMGVCPVEAACLHWQLCRNGYIIADGSGIIDKSLTEIPKEVLSRYESCGGDMICCQIPLIRSNEVNIQHSFPSQSITAVRPGSQGAQFPVTGDKLEQTKVVCIDHPSTGPHQPHHIQSFQHSLDTQSPTSAIRPTADQVHPPLTHGTVSHPSDFQNTGIQLSESHFGSSQLSPSAGEAPGFDDSSLLESKKEHQSNFPGPKDTTFHHVAPGISLEHDHLKVDNEKPGINLGTSVTTLKAGSGSQVVPSHLEAGIVSHQPEHLSQLDTPRDSDSKIPGHPHIKPVPGDSLSAGHSEQPHATLDTQSTLFSSKPQHTQNVQSQSAFGPVESGAQKYDHPDINFQSDHHPDSVKTFPSHLSQPERVPGLSDASFVRPGTSVIHKQPVSDSTLHQAQHPLRTSDFPGIPLPSVAPDSHLPAEKLVPESAAHLHDKLTVDEKGVKFRPGTQSSSEHSVSQEPVHDSTFDNNVGQISVTPDHAAGPHLPSVHHGSPLTISQKETVQESFHSGKPKHPVLPAVDSGSSQSQERPFPSEESHAFHSEKQLEGHFGKPEKPDDHRAPTNVLQPPNTDTTFLTQEHANIPVTQDIQQTQTNLHHADSVIPAESIVSKQQEPVNIVRGFHDKPDQPELVDFYLPPRPSEAGTAGVTHEVAEHSQVSGSHPAGQFEFQSVAGDISDKPTDHVSSTAGDQFVATHDVSDKVDQSVQHGLDTLQQFSGSEQTSLIGHRPLQPDTFGTSHGERPKHPIATGPTFSHGQQRPQFGPDQSHIDKGHYEPDKTGVQISLPALVQGTFTAGTASPQQATGGVSMGGMMGGMMMGPMVVDGLLTLGGMVMSTSLGNPIAAGSCSAGMYCVSEQECNPYNGFIILHQTEVAATFANAPTVPLLGCLTDNNGVEGFCCQLPHPLLGPDGKPID